ncbi:hypothetical protein HZS_2680 [Henneguya salminicola]|nr:hypothetical protein HZS_2680 [Henneguya salminicola]
MFAAIAFIQEDNVIRVYEALQEHICLNGLEQQFRELLNYYDGTFMGRHPSTGRSQPFFSIQLWNPSERTENRISRTNNKVEGGHNAFAHLVEGNYPNIFNFFSLFAEETESG